jgi:hypothetical protein
MLVALLIEQFLAFYVNRNFVTALTKACHSTLSPFSWIQYTLHPLYLSSAWILSSQYWPRSMFSGRSNPPVSKPTLLISCTEHTLLDFSRESNIVVGVAIRYELDCQSANLGWGKRFCLLHSRPDRPFALCTVAVSLGKSVWAMTLTIYLHLAPRVRMRMAILLNPPG